MPGSVSGDSNDIVQEIVKQTPRGTNDGSKTSSNGKQKPSNDLIKRARRKMSM